VFVYNGGEFFGYLLNSLFPGYFLKSVSHLFEGMHKAVGMVLMIDDVQSLTAGVTLRAGIVLISTNFNYMIVLDSNLKPTEICSQHTRCFFPIHY
jgi:hypothetical protein